MFSLNDKVALVTGASQGIGRATALALAQEKDRRLEVAVVIGTDPATTFSAIVPAPPEVEEFVIAAVRRQFVTPGLSDRDLVTLHVARIVLRPLIKLAASSSEQRARELHHEAHMMCFIANSVKCEIVTEPVFSR